MLLCYNWSLYLCPMFIRTKIVAGGKTKIQIVESVRESGKVRQRVVRHVSTATTSSELEQYRHLAAHILSELESSVSPALFPAKDLATLVMEGRKQALLSSDELPVKLKRLREESRIVTGIHDVYGKLYDQVGFPCVLKSCKVSAKVLKDIVMARLASPCSKRASIELLNRDFGIHLAPEKVYRMMDTLTKERINHLQQISWQHSKRLLNEQIHVMFYDCTTLYFQSFTEDGLRSFGYSKDHKFNQGQVLLALLVTEEGLPVGYDLYPGNTYEGDTFKQAIEKIKQRYGVRQAVIVADSGLLSRQNFDLLEEYHLKFIVGARLKSLSVKWQDKVLDNAEYTKLHKEEDIYRIHSFAYSKKRTLIVTHSLKRAEKDRKDREKAVLSLKEKLQKSKNPANLISNYGYRKYIKVEGEMQVEINQEKLAHDARWDGLHGIFTNIIDRKVEDIVAQYHGLWQVEESFRIGKYDLQMRPVFHRNAARIHAHIAICYIAFCLIRYLQHMLIQTNGERMSAKKVREELYRVQESVLMDTVTQEQYVIPSKTSKEALAIYECMKIKRNVVPYKLMAGR